jgi:uncharacterized protein (DUF1501 family)
MPLTRRQLIADVVLGGTAALLAPAWNPFSIFGAEAGAAEDAAPSTRTLVVLTLSGGNDGLNTVVPVGDSRYAALRADVALQGGETLPIGSGLALHGSLPGIKKLWDQGQVAIVNSVGSPDPSFSHFRSMAVWQAGTTTPSASGWLGRWLESTGTTSMRALGVGNSLPPMLVGDRMAGVGLSTAQLRLPGTPSLLAGFGALGAPSKDDSRMAARAAAAHRELREAADTITNALARQASATQLLTLADQLGVVSRLIRAGMPTRVYVVTLGGFDTHTNQKATQTRLFAQLDSAVSSFFSQLAGDTYGAGTVMLLHSEFGRRVAPNADGGTDHGAAAPLFVVGPSVKGGLYGDPPNLAGLVDGNLPITVNFRSVYSTLLSGVLGADPQPILGPPVPASIPFLR